MICHGPTGCIKQEKTCSHLCNAPAFNQQQGNWYFLAYPTLLPPSEFSPQILEHLKWQPVYIVLLARYAAPKQWV